MSRLIQTDPNIQLDTDPESHEFGCYVFDLLLEIITLSKQEVLVNMLDNSILTQGTNHDIGLSNAEIQNKDDFYKHIFNMSFKNHS